MTAYGSLCTKVYDITKPLASGFELDFYKQHLQKSDLILEPMCGTGRLLIPLLQEGYTVHGLDNSPDMLANCRKRISSLGLPEPTLFEMAVENMQLRTQYDAIIIPFGSLQLFYPRTQAFSALQIFKKHLRPQGKLFLDLFVPWEALYANAEEEFSRNDVVIDEHTIIRCEFHTKVNKYEQYYTGDGTYTEIKNGKITNTEKETLRVAWFYRYEMELILEKCGFNTIHYQPHTQNKEEMMIFVAQAS